jgi:hypothetical protein
MITPLESAYPGSVRCKDILNFHDNLGLCNNTIVPNLKIVEANQVRKNGNFFSPFLTKIGPFLASPIIFSQLEFT